MKMKNLFTWIVAALVIALGACSSTSGSAGLQNGSADKIIEGKTTLAEVRELLGEPAHAQTTDKGDKIWSYYYSEAKIYPVLGFNKSGTKSLNIRFNKNGIVIAKDAGQSGAQF